jgi:hypothetical protein
MSPKLLLIFLFSTKFLYVLVIISLHVAYAPHVTRLDLTIETE